MTAVLASTATDALESWELVQRVQAGDNEAYGEIYRRHYDSVLKYIRRRVGREHLAEDLAADVFVRGLRRIDSFTWQGRNFGAFLATIAHNLVVDYFKSGRYRLEYICDEPRDACIDPFTSRIARGASSGADPAPAPDEAAIRWVTLRRVRPDLLDALMALTDEQRQVLVLRFFNDMSVTETATAMRKKEGAVKALQSRAVQSMRRFLPEGFEW